MIQVKQRPAGRSAPTFELNVPQLPGRALCAVDPEAWFPHPTDHEGKAAAVAVCSRCECLVACGRWAVQQRVKDGVWGGLTEEDRRRMWRALSKRRQEVSDS